MNEAGDLIDAYASALIACDVDTVITTLSADAEFHSPFRVWRRRQVSSVYRARCQAFDNLMINSVIRDRDQAVILWNATVRGAEVEAAEVVLVSEGSICRVDVFLRPVAALDAVHQAMVAAWP
jgi:hypothetical protein